VRIDMRRAKRLSAKATRLTVRGRAGTHRYTVTLVDAKGKVLARFAGRFEILR
jgi:hypothetical protein